MGPVEDQGMPHRADPSGTSYLKVACHIRELMNTPPYKGQISLTLDATGIGNPAFDLPKSLDIGCPITDVTITADIKRDLIANLHMMFEMRDLRIPKTLTGVPPLLQELSAMRATTLITGNTRYEAAPGRTRRPRHRPVSRRLAG